MSASKLKLYWRLQLAAHFLQKRADRDLLESGNVTTAQLGVIAVIGNGTDVTQKDVAVALGLNESAITAMVRRLIGLGYVERQKSEHDGRAKLLNLTDDGHAIHQNTRPPFKKINNRIESVLDDTEIENLADYLERLTETFR
ncbi:MarR family winged helix-turn-helix transcriptional regulator [Sphingorhabdus sp. EL138]|uniref:MarR family winged helix-turn-helix transcriptional regulator n=1 Tax=Sphingorhabdus sp. EL138 TaxID=2073156 RepID=UPI000D69808A|nr:MarR family winged helix-turn-helix transcriptional regulator [Sphingorhabdus sp. EL138]